jgi:hypothetical protein
MVLDKEYFKHLEIIYIEFLNFSHGTNVSADSPKAIHIQRNELAGTCQVFLFLLRVVFRVSTRHSRT